MTLDEHVLHALLQTGPGPLRVASCSEEQIEIIGSDSARPKDTWPWLRALSEHLLERGLFVSRSRVRLRVRSTPFPALGPPST